MAVTTKDIMRIFKELGVEGPLDPDVALLDQGVDSIDLPRAAAAIEKKYKIDLSDAKCEQLKTITLFAKFVSSKL